jgi:hypothetical protein
LRLKPERASIQTRPFPVNKLHSIPLHLFRIPLNEHLWCVNRYPKFKVAILHDSATPTPNTPQSEDSRTSDEDSEEETRPVKAKVNKSKRWDALISATVNHPDGLLLTSYEQLRIQREKLLDVQWGYVVLDEGHRIRNPDADITLVCKQVQLETLQIHGQDCFGFCWGLRMSSKGLQQRGYG